MYDVINSSFPGSPSSPEGPWEGGWYCGPPTETFHFVPVPFFVPKVRLFHRKKGIKKEIKPGRGKSQVFFRLNEYLLARKTTQFLLCFKQRVEHFDGIKIG